MRATGRVARLAAAVLLGGAGAWWLGPAGARAAGGLSVTAAAQPPPAGDPADEVVIAGSAQADTGYSISEVDIAVQSPTSSVVIQSACQHQVAHTNSAGDYSAKCQYPYNGAYQASVVAKEVNAIGGTVTSAPATVSFSVYVNPAAPTGVAGTLSSDGSTVTITWNPNPEPDVAYAVLRDGNQIGDITKSTSATDNTVAPATAYHYQVVAGRPGPNNSVLTTTSSSAEVDTPAPPPTTTTTAAAAAAGGTSNGGSNVAVPGGTKAAPAASGPVVVSAPKLDMASFAAVLNKSRSAPAPQAVALPGDGEGPDTGYNATLPFGPQSATDQAEDGPADPAAVTAAKAPVLGASDAVDNVRPWAVFGLGVLLIAVLAHVLWMRGEINRAAALEALPVADLPEPE